jgi:hypothetical protein
VCRVASTSSSRIGKGTLLPATLALTNHKYYIYNFSTGTVLSAVQAHHNEGGMVMLAGTYDDIT